MQVSFNMMALRDTEVLFKVSKPSLSIFRITRNIQAKVLELNSAGQDPFGAGFDTVEEPKIQAPSG